MKNPDPLNHYCNLIQESINEGGSKIKDARAGLTSDMAGRWTISSFSPKEKNKKETPQMKEAVYANNAGIMEVFKFMNIATEAQKREFDDLVKAGNQNAALKLVEKVLGITFQGDLTLENNS